jgi:hypothetical protein
MGLGKMLATGAIAAAWPTSVAAAMGADANKT